MAETGMSAKSPSVIINDWDTYGLPALKGVTAATLYHVVCASGSVEYPRALPANCRRLNFQCQQDAITRYAWVTGKVATPTAPYWTLKASAVYTNDQIKLASQTLYLGAATHSLTWEIEAWT